MLVKQEVSLTPHLDMYIVFFDRILCSFTQVSNEQRIQS